MRMMMGSKATNPGTCTNLPLTLSSYVSSDWLLNLSESQFLFSLYEVELIIFAWLTCVPSLCSNEPTSMRVPSEGQIIT